MFLKSLNLFNFRSYSRQEFKFSQETNLIIGPNASGKTNLLEAIYLLATGKSFRVKGTEREMIRYGEEMARVMGEVEGLEEVEEKLEIILTRGEVANEKVAKKKYLLNGVGKRAADFVGNLRAVYFGPEDLELVTDSPSLRRHYLDAVLLQVDREYARASLSYEKGLRARNKLLELAQETGEVDRRKFYFWDQLLIKNGNILTGQREEFIEFLNSTPILRCIGVEKGEEEQEKEHGSGFRVEYDRSTISAERLSQYDEEEIAAGMTLVGPHRDDFRIKIGGFEGVGGDKGRDLSIYGSRGEQRLAILWLKLGELSFIRGKTDDLPVLLLDDIFSELDMEHRKSVFGVVENQQTIITTADLGMLEKKWLEGVRIINLENEES